MLVFKLEYAGKCQVIINGDTLLNKDSYQIVPSMIPFKVETGKEYKIEIGFPAVFDWADASLKLNLGREIPVNYDALINKLKGIDVVVFIGGISPKLEGEEMPIEIPGFKGGDRIDINLSASQRKYLQELKRAGKEIVFVNCSGSAIALTPETESCDAILQAWYGGQSGGQTVADVLFEDYNPSESCQSHFYDHGKIIDTDEVRLQFKY